MAFHSRSLRQTLRKCSKSRFQQVLSRCWSTGAMRCYRSHPISEGFRKHSRLTIGEVRRSFSDQSESRIPLATIENDDTRQNSVQDRNPRTPPWKQSAASTAQPSAKGLCQYWSHRLYKTEDGKPIMVHYCNSLATAEKVAQFFVNETILGFDMEWQAAATTYSSIQENISTIQLASRNRIAIFHIAQFKPDLSLDDLVPQSLKSILENPKITKTGVSIKGDSTRLRKYLGINARGPFELSHLYKLIKYCHTSPHLINKYRVRLADQVQEHFGLPLAKEIDVRCSNWQRPITAQQAHYAAADAYAGYHLFVTMDAKRRALDPVPPLPAHDELNLSIRIKEESVPVKGPGTADRFSGGTRPVKRTRKQKQTKKDPEDLGSADMLPGEFRSAEKGVKACKKRVRAIQPGDDPAFEIVKGAGTPIERTQPVESDDMSGFKTMSIVARPRRRVQDIEFADGLE
ncbi:ribonuclease H-like domain-containing protein [Aspergillus recurvatus]